MVLSLTIVHQSNQLTTFTYYAFTNCGCLKLSSTLKLVRDNDHITCRDVGLFCANLYTKQDTAKYLR